MKIVNLLNKTIAGGLLLTCLLPLLKGPFLFFPYITGKNMAFRILTEILFILYLLVVWFNKKSAPLFSPVSITVFVFVLILLITALTGVNPQRSFFSNFERMEGWLTFIHLAAWFAVAAGIFRKPGQWDFFFKSNLVVSAVVSLYSILQAMHLLPTAQGRIDGRFGNPIYLSYYMYFNIFFCFFYLFRIKKLTRQSMAYGALAAAQIFVLLQTATRGAILGFLFGIGMAVFWFFKNAEKKTGQRRLAMLFLMFAALLVTVFLALQNLDSSKSNSVLRRFAAISISNLSQDTERVAIWKIAWQGIRQRPVLGWGLENFDRVFDSYYDPRLAGSSQWFDRSHNTYLEWWLGSGIFGLLAYLGIFAAAFFTICKPAAQAFSLQEKSVLLGLLSGYMVINFFDFDNLISYLAFFSILAFLHAMSRRQADLPEADSKPTGVHVSRLQWVGMGLIVTCGTTLMITLNRKPLHSLLMLNQAFSSQPEGYGQNLDYFQKALEQKTFGRAEISRRLSEMAVTSITSKKEQLSENLKEKLFAVTCEEMQKLLAEEPVCARNEAAFGVFLNRFASNREALEHLTRAHLLSPRKPAILIEMTLALLTMQKNEQALLIARKAFELNPDFVESRKIYALSAIVCNRLDLAKSLLLPVFHTMALDDERFIMAYSITRQWQQVIEIYTSRLEKNPADINNRIKLAQAFLQNHDPLKAVQQLETAIRTNPSYREQGLLMIQKIRAGYTE